MARRLATFVSQQLLGGDLATTNAFNTSHRQILRCFCSQEAKQAATAAKSAATSTSTQTTTNNNPFIQQQLASFRRWSRDFKAVPNTAKLLGVAGIIPFIVLAPPIANTLHIFLPFHVVENAASFQVAYGASIASFLGAVHWGMALSSTLTGPVANMIAAERYAWSVLPCLLAWPTTQMHPGPASLVLTTLLPVIYYVDKRFGKRGLLPSWYLVMRAPLTAAATFGMATTAAYYIYLEQERADEYHRAKQIGRHVVDGVSEVQS